MKAGHCQLPNRKRITTFEMGKSPKLIVSSPIVGPTIVTHILSSPLIDQVLSIDKKLSYKIHQQLSSESDCSFV